MKTTRTYAIAFRPGCAGPTCLGRACDAPYVRPYPGVVQRGNVKRAPDLYDRGLDRTKPVYPYSSVITHDSGDLYDRRAGRLKLTCLGRASSVEAVHPYTHPYPCDVQEKRGTRTLNLYDRRSDRTKPVHSYSPVITRDSGELYEQRAAAAGTTSFASYVPDVQAQFDVRDRFLASRSESRTGTDTSEERSTYTIVYYTRTEAGAL